MDLLEQGAGADGGQRVIVGWEASAPVVAKSIQLHVPRPMQFPVHGSEGRASRSQRHYVREHHPARRL